MAKDTLQSVERTFEVLEMLSGRGTMGVRELAHETGLNTTVVFRILSTLVQLGYIIKDTETDRYELTYKLLSVGERVAERNTAASLAHKKLVHLARDCGETVHFVERSGTNIRYTDKVTPDANIFATGSYVGLELPLAATAVGKAILSKLTDKEVRKVWENSDIIQHTPHTICDIDTLLVELADAKKTGFAYDMEERELGLMCVGVSLADYKGEYNYGISISAPVVRMTEEHMQEIRQMLSKTRDEIAVLIGQEK